MGAIPLPDGSNAPDFVRRLRAMDAEFFGTIYARAGNITGDLTLGGSLLGNWDGTVPLSLPDAGASTGFAFDGNAGDAQFLGSLYLGDDLRIAGEAIYFGPTSLIRWNTDRLVIESDLIDLAHVADLRTVSASGIRLAGMRGTSASSTDIYDDFYPNVSRWMSDEANDLDTPRATFHTRLGGTSLYNNLSTGEGPHYYDIVHGSSFASIDALADHGENPEVDVYLNDASFARDTFIYGQALFAGGSASAPSVSFDGDTDNGMYSAGTNLLGFARAGAEALILLSDYARFNGTTTGGPRINYAAGDAALPTWSFYGNHTTGMYRAGTNLIGMATSGTNRLTIGTKLYPKVAVTGTTGTEALPAYAFESRTSSGISLESNYSVNISQNGQTAFRTRNSSTNRGLLLLDGSSTYPSCAFELDGDTGIYRPADDRLAIAVGGNLRLSIDNSASNNSTNAYFVVSMASHTSSANLFWNSSGGGVFVSSSSKVLKENIKRANWLADLKLRPVEWDSIGDDSRHQYGFIAEDIIDVLPLAGEFHDDGRVLNYDTRAVLAIAVAKINRLEDWMEDCTCR